MLFFSVNIYKISYAMLRYLRSVFVMDVTRGHIASFGGEFIFRGAEKLKLYGVLSCVCIAKNPAHKPGAAQQATDRLT